MNHVNGDEICLEEGDFQLLELFAFQTTENASFHSETQKPRNVMLMSYQAPYLSIYGGTSL